MKNLYYLLIPVLFFASCKLPQYSNTNRQVPDPYVELKDGTNIQAEKVQVKYGVIGLGTRIIADGNKYNPKEVAFFSTGENKYACVGKKPLICPEVVDGKINLYRQLYEEVDMKTGMSHTRAIYFMQDANAKEVTAITYNRLAKIIQPDAAAHSYLDRYQKTKKMTTVGKLASLGAFVGGIALIGSAPAPAIAAMSAGFLGYFSFSVVRMVNRIKLYKAIDVYNKSE
jgi:hypothetical protein